MFDPYDVMDETFKRNGTPQLSDTVKIYFNDRLTSCFGRAKYSNKTGIYEIEMSENHWRVREELKSKNTIIHEACHISARVLYGKQAWGHGRDWKNLMILNNLPPIPCGGKALPNTPNMVNVKCGCGTSSVTKIIARRILTGHTTYSCRQCKANLTVVI